jgi:molybdopterin synthase sulfur carrier subunit
VQVRYFAGARAAAGVSEESADASTLRELVDELGERHGDRLTVVLRACSFLLDGVAAHGPHDSLAGVGTIDVLPPFAGG